MNYNRFEYIMSQERLSRYLRACNNNTRMAMTLYRYNLRLSQEMFVIISCFEVALRNAVDNMMVMKFGDDWLRDSILPGGIFFRGKCRETFKIINRAYVRLKRQNKYTHAKLIAEMEFGVWKYMFSAPQFKASGQILLGIFPNKPKSTPRIQYDNLYVFNKLSGINNLRNRIAHHEPICFRHHTSYVDISFIQRLYERIENLFMWLGIDMKALLYGLDHVTSICKDIELLTAPDKVHKRICYDRI